MARILVTGGSGFIGTNLLEWLLEARHTVLNLDIKPPQNPEHGDFYRHVDILDRQPLTEAFAQFAPTHVVHLAARCDLNEKQNIEGYRANTEGTRNVIDAISTTPSIERSIFASTRLVCPTGYHPKSDQDYCANTLYGESKVIGEKMVRDAQGLPGAWCIIRPTSIWGPWYGTDYTRFFVAVAKGWYFHPGKVDPPKLFGFVKNVAFQIDTLLFAAEKEVHGKVFYLADYYPMAIRRWAETIAHTLGGRKIRTIPGPIMRIAAWTGDLLHAAGLRRFPMSSFRLRNVWTDTTGVPLEPIERVTGNLPYSMKDGVETTVDWLVAQQLVDDRGASSPV